MIEWLTTLLIAGALWAEDGKVEEPFETHTLRPAATNPTDDRAPFVVLPPAEVEPGQKYPLVLFLHGAGERGSDPALVLAHFPRLMATPEFRKRFPCYLVCPQCEAGKRWVEVDWSRQRHPVLQPEPTLMMQRAMASLDQALAEFPIDPDRTYLTGLSMGGFGSWDLAMRRPEQFAAVVPICGGGDPDKVQLVAKLPIWVVHGGADPVVPVARSREMVEALQKIGSPPRYSELKGVGHDSWTPAYTDPEGVVPWMFSQRRGK